jgi:serine/threonine-protein phosphatase 5
VDKAYAGPKLDVDADGKFKPSLNFIREMMQWFKDGKALPKRYVWEIILGADEHFRSEASLVDIPIPSGASCDVIGDVHGTF